MGRIGARGFFVCTRFFSFFFLFFFSRSLSCIVAGFCIFFDLGFFSLVFFFFFFSFFLVGPFYKSHFMVCGCGQIYDIHTYKYG